MLKTQTGIHKLVCVRVVGQLTHTEGELYPPNILQRKHVYSSFLCVAAWFEMESITSFPVKRAERHEWRGGIGRGVEQQREKTEDENLLL